MISAFFYFQPTLNRLFSNYIKLYRYLISSSWNMKVGEVKLNPLPKEKLLPKSPALLGLNHWKNSLFNISLKTSYFKFKTKVKMKVKEKRKKVVKSASSIFLNNYFTIGRKVIVKTKITCFLKSYVTSLFTFFWKRPCYLRIWFLIR